MKIKEGFQLCEVGDSSIVIAMGDSALNMAGLTTLNETGVYLWKRLEQGMDETQILDEMTKDYEIDRATAKADFDEFCTKLKGAGFLE